MHHLVKYSLFLVLLLNSMVFAVDPLPAWKDGDRKKAIVEFVQTVTQKDSKQFVPPAERIAVFDNDGTLWCERPVYVQLTFALERVKALASKHPEWKNKQPFKAVLENDQKALIASGKKGLMEIIMASHTGMTTEQFGEIASHWINTARHPKYKQLYNACVYQPMLELLTYLRANGFKTFIVSGGGVEFMRPWTEKVYGIPPEQVVGTTIKTKYVERDGKPMLIREPAIDFIDDKEGKPVAINKFIGRRPILAVGNSDGDYEMLRYTTAGKGPSLGVIIHHTDEKREYAYDRKSHIGQLNKALDEANKRQWQIIDMKKDWKKIFPFSR